MVIAILGIALLLLGYYFSIHILWVLGIVAIIIGLIVVVLGHFGYGGPPWYRRLERKRKEAWAEPRLPPWIKVNPESPPGSHSDGLEPGDISMVTAAEEFLEDDDEDGA